MLARAGDPGIRAGWTKSRRSTPRGAPLLLAWQGVFGAIFGLMGTLVATPILVCVQILIRHLWVERRLGKDARPAST